MTQPQKFGFDTEFGDAGVVIAAPPPRPKRFFTPEEVEAIRDQAYREGETSAVARAEEAHAHALAVLAEQARSGLSVLAQVAQAHKAGCAELALVAARRVADAALDRFPAAALEAALEALAQEVESAPRLVVRMARIDERVQAAVEAVAQAIGFAGQIVFKAEPGPAAAAFVIEWGDGRAVFDPEGAAERVEAAVRAALASEGLHGDNLSVHGEPR